MIGVALLLTALCMGVTAQAGNARAARKQVESSLLVKGSITIAADGSVLAHTLDPKAPLGDALQKFVDGNIAAWRFDPVMVDGRVVTAKVPVSMLLVATPAQDGGLSVSIASTHFGTREDLPSTETVTRVKLTPPQFPRNALYMGGSGTVYVIVQVGRDGTVINADAEQVNLRVAGTDGEMATLRKEFTIASLRAARTWTFTPPVTGSEAGKSTWLVRVPVTFVADGRRTKPAKPGQWDSYIPGPRNMDMPWASEELKTAGAPDALSEGGVYPLQQGAKLLTPPTT